MARFRLSAVIPFVCSTVAFALLVVLVIAGSNPHQGSQYYLISLNTSRAGDRLVEIKPTNDVAHGALGSNGGSSGFLNGVGNIIPGLNTAIGNLTVEIDNELQQLVTEVIHEAKKTAGVKDQYNIYLQNICYGSLTRPDDENSVRITDCPDFGSVAKSISGVSSKVKSYIAIGTTNVSIPFLETLGQSGHTAGAGLLAATTANAALVYVGLVGAGVGALLSTTAVVAAAAAPPGPRARLLVVANVAFAALAPAALTASAVVVSVVVAVLRTVVAGAAGAALTVEAAVGARALALTWAAWALSLVAALYWALVWFVDARQSAWLRTRRPADHVGCWRKTFAAARLGLKVRDFKEDKGPLSG